ncbi:MAG: protein yceI precursor [Candidatus Melainabacteria bacterium]|nr:MAG: protein yceI precursor [Candidatus Melainabacteria bacterium]
MIRKSAVLALVAFGLVMPSARAADTWTIDPMHTAANFSIKHMMISTVRGGFGKVSGTVEYDGKNLAKAKVDATIDASSINTNEAKRDEHLRGKDFFDTEKFPNITFKSTAIKPKGKGKFAMTGDLTMHGVTKPVTLDVDGPSQAIKDKQGNHKVGFSASGTIKRKDFGITYNSVLDGGGVALGEEVPITLDVEMSKPGDGAKSAGDGAKPAAKG